MPPPSRIPTPMVIGGGLNLQKLSLFAIYAPLPTHSDTYGNSVYVLDIAQEILAYNYISYLW